MSKRLLMELAATTAYDEERAGSERWLSRERCAALAEVPLPHFDELVAKGKLPKPYITCGDYPLWTGDIMREAVASLKYGTIYFILSEKMEMLKIGFASSVSDRLANLQTASADRLKLLAAYRGDYVIEKRLHARFAQYRVHGEWFNYEGALKEYVEAL